MRDYSCKNYCDFLWITDLLGLKKNDRNVFSAELRKNSKSSSVTVSNVIIFGTIIEVKQIKSKEFLYQLDDGTGVIACKHSEEQFEEIIRLIENENAEILNQTLELKEGLEQSSVIDISTDDSVFNDKSIQLEEINFNKRSKIKGLQSIWDDIYKSFSCLIEPYNIGDSVIIQGKLYTYFNTNQIYVNNIRTMDVTEEIMLLTVKLEVSLDEPVEIPSTSKVQLTSEKRFSGLMTFDNIQHLNPKIPNSRNIEMPNLRDDLLNVTPEIVPPNLESAVTFDTFTGKI